MQTNRCGHFSAEVELISLQHTAVVLRVPIRRCALAERMIAILSRTDEGRDVAAKIRIMDSGAGTAANGIEHGARFRAAFGPDLEAITRAECTSARCAESCTPGFRQVLRHFGYADEADEETGEGCLEIPPDMADAVL
jgi:hypothetical protein